MACVHNGSHFLSFVLVFPLIDLVTSLCAVFSLLFCPIIEQDNLRARSSFKLVRRNSPSLID